VPGVFEKYRADIYKYRFSGQLIVGCIAGGIPTDPNVAEGWLRTKLGADKDDLIRELVVKTMDEMGVDVDQAAKLVDAQKHLNGFKRLRCPTCPPQGHFCDTGAHQLFIENRQLKAALKEAASIAVAAGNLTARKWGTTNKGLLSFLAEHIFILEDRLPLFRASTPGLPGDAPVLEPDGVNQRFVHTFRGSGIQYEEYVEEAAVDFTLISDWDFTEKQWAAIFTTGEQNGLGASRSQGYGRYEVTRWDPAPSPWKK
jgi:hypothetical protein